MEIRKAIESDRDEILQVHRTAFGEQEGPVISRLVDSLLEDTTAKPCLSLAAVEGGRIVGHVLFTKVVLNGASPGLRAQILAPLAVLPEQQQKGVGGRLIEAGKDILRQAGVKLIFVLGHPGYYPRYGFSPAGVRGYEAPFPIPEEHAGAWMVQELAPGIIGVETGRVECADALNKEEHWRE